MGSRYQRPATSNQQPATSDQMKNKLIIISFLLLALLLLLAERRDFRRQIHSLKQSVESLRLSNEELKRDIAEHRRRLAEFEEVLEGGKANDGKGLFPYLLMLAFLIITASVFISLLVLKKKLSSLEKRICSEIRESVHPPGPPQGGILEKDSQGGIPEKDSQGGIPERDSQGGISEGDSQGKVSREDEAEVDHELASRLGLEIHRMRKRIAHMPRDTKGRGALENALKRLEQSLADKGYELPDLLGKPFAEGMTARARFLPSDDLNPGEQIITKVVQPQINFKGVLIRPGEVEVSIGE